MTEQAHNLPNRVMAADEERGYARLGPDQEFELRHLHPRHSSEPTLQDDAGQNGHLPPQAHHSHMYGQAAYAHATDRVQEFWDRLRGKGRRPIGLGESIRNIVTSSCKSPLPPTLSVPLPWVACKPLEN